jgi:hypothetical protein
MPPKIMFRNSIRLKGLEFPCCIPCNAGTKLSDTVAAWVGRFSPERPEDHDDIEKLHKSIWNNARDLYREMWVRPIRRRQILRKNGLPMDHGILKADGPLLNKHMLTFAAKFGFAMHFECIGDRVPDQGGVFVMWRTNVDALEGNLPHQLLRLLPTGTTLRMGAREASEQFLYSAKIVDEGTGGLFWAQFREAFTMIAATTRDRSSWLKGDPNFGPIFVPSAFRT